MNDKDKRNIIIACSVILIVLVLVTIGVTYAFFQLQISNESTNTNIELTTGEINNIVLSGKVENFHLTVDANDMSKSKLGEYYATTDTIKNYADNKSDGITNLGTITIEGTLSEKQTCTAIANIEIISDIEDQIEKGNFELGLIYGEEEVTIDLKDSNKSTIEFELNEESPSYIKAYLRLNNADRDQSYLADKEISVKVNIESFECSNNNSEKNLELIQEKGGETFTLKNGMYRFVGTYSQVTNNYICFGTDNTETCKGNPTEFMYRIIGVTSEEDPTIGLKVNQLKIIKATPSNTSQQWNSLYLPKDCETNGEENGKCKWDGSDIKIYLNEAVKNKWENGEEWEELINSQKWYNADYTSIPNTEPTTSQTTNPYQVGLMYMTDYMNAGPNASNNWLFIKNGWSTNSTLAGNSLYEWTMSRYGLRGSYYYAWQVFTDGTLYTNNLNLSFAVRPVFYVSPNITLTGEGNTESPFIIHSA